MAANAATGTVTLLFTDLVDSTGVLQRLGEEGAEQFRRTHFRLLREAVSVHGGEEVKSLGDGLMVVFGSALDATRCAVAMQQAVERHNRRGGERLNVRVGLHVGEPIRDEEDYFGTPVVTAKRLCDRADGGQVLASDLVRVLIGSRSGLSFRDLGPLALKGLAEPVPACEVAWAPIETKSAPPRQAMASRSPFVGREREVAVLERILAETAGGSGRVAIIAGEPGIGKTRLLTEVAEQAASQGWLVLFGRTYESEGMPPYLPFTEALQSHLRGIPDSRLVAELGDRAAELALILPDVARRLPGLPPLAALDPGSERYRLFEAVCDYLAALARGPGREGLLLGIEDLHWADESMLLLLEHLGRRLRDAPIALVLNYRDTELQPGSPLARTIEQFTRLTPCEHLSLRSLDQAGVSLLLAGLSGSDPPPRLVDLVFNETEGNPLFVHEVYRYLADERRLFDDEGRWRLDVRVGEVDVPRGVRLVIGRRIQRVSEGCRRALTFAAIIGRVFDFDLLREVSEMTEANLLDAMDEAERAHLVTSAPDRGGALMMFTHELIRQTLAGDLSLPRRRALHLAVAEAIETLYKSNPGARAAEMAGHFLSGGRRGDLPRVISHAIEAAERAMVQAAYEDAARYFQMALDAHERSDGPDEARRCEILLALGLAIMKSGDTPRGDAINLAAAEAARTAGLPDLLAQACLATARYWQCWPNARLIPLLEAALASIPDGDSPRRSELLSLLACQRSWAGSREASAAREEGIAMARRLNDVRTLAFALFFAYSADIPYLNRLEQWLEANAEVIALAAELGDTMLECAGHCSRLHGALILGDLAAVDAATEAHARLGEALECRQIMHPVAVRNVRALLVGPLSRAERQEEEREKVWGQYHAVPDLVEAAAVHTLLLRWEQGRLADLLPDYRATAERQGAPLVQSGLAFICAMQGDIPEARALMEHLGRDRFAAVRAHRDWPFALALLSQACSLVGDAGHAEVLYSLLLSRARYVASTYGANACLGSTSRYLGLLATTLGRFDDAERHFDDSDAMNTRLGARPLLAHTKVDRARMHVARHDRGDLARAQALLEEAISAFEGLEMSYHAGRARELLANLPQGVPARLAYPDGLSVREVEVLRLIARGQSNKQIAEELVLSIRTVERHIANVYAKIGASTKAQATAYAFGHSLN